MATQLACRALKERRKYFSPIACKHTAKDFLKYASEHHPDIAVISAILQGDPEGGVKLLREMRAGTPKTRAVVLLDCSEPQQVIEAFSAGAKGVVCQTEPFEALCKCIRSVHAGQIWASSQELQWIVKVLEERGALRLLNAKGVPLLTKREEQIVRMVVEGLPNSEIGLKLGVSAHTVRNHLFHVYEKLGVSTRAELILYASSGLAASHGLKTETAHGAQS